MFVVSFCYTVGGKEVYYRKGVNALLGRGHLAVNHGIFFTYVAYKSLSPIQSLSDVVPYYHSPESVSVTLGLMVLWSSVFLGSILPDIDSKNSALGRFFPFIELLIGHRRLHTIWVIGLLGIAAYFLSGLWQLFFIGLTFSYILHVLVDSVSNQGVDLFWPIGKGYISYKGGETIKDGHVLKLYRTGGVAEKIITYVMLFVCLLSFVLFIYNYYISSFVGGG